MLVRDWMTTGVATVTTESSISDAAALMREKRVKHLPVLKAGKLAGILSDRDIKQYLPSKGTSLDIYELNYLLAQTKVGDIMKSPVFTVAPETPVEEAAMAMHDRSIGCAPVVEGDRLVGIISDRDIFKVLVEITGVRSGGHRLAVNLEDRPGSIKDLADIVRAHGFRLLSILSSSEKSAPGQRYVVIRTRGNGDFEALKKDLESQRISVVHLC